MSEQDYKEYSNCWIKDDILIVKQDFIGELDEIEYKFLSNIKQLMFSNSKTIDSSLYYYNRNLDINSYFTFEHKSETMLNITFDKNIYTNTLTKIFPKITHLCLPIYFNNKIDILPLSLTHLILHFYFNQELDNLPSLLMFLSLSHCFNKRLDNLPSSLTHLYLSHKYNNSLDDLPSSLTHLKFDTTNSSNCFDKSLDNLPINLEYIGLPQKYTHKINNLPKNIKTIKCSSQYKYNFDSSITIIIY